MAESALTTRRAFFGTLAGLSAIAGAAAARTPLVTSAHVTPMSEAAQFIHCMAGLHVNGRRAATNAIDAGWAPSECYAVMMVGDAELLPAVLFQRTRPDGTREHATFRPGGAD